MKASAKGNGAAPSLALYRKYRPRTFDDVVGQDHVVNVLKGAIRDDKIAHAYLFCGSRGIGKTSIARILAREIGTSEVDIYEIDAASHTGVDDIRALTEAVFTRPFESKYKVYILDEVHMLSKSAFNALLKTLEEPPSHVVFVLATTEEHKVPDTVVSRCQSFTFNKPGQAVLRDVVLDTAKAEGVTLERSSAELIALLGDGSFRDTLGILQKVMVASADDKISADEVELVTGAPKGEVVNDFIDAVASKDATRALEAVRGAAERNVSAKVFLKLALQKLRQVLLLRFGKEHAAAIEKATSDTDFIFLKETAGDVKGKHVTAQTLLALLDAYERIDGSYIPELPIELAVMGLCQPTE